LRVFGDVDKDRAGTSAIGDQEGFTEGARNVLRFVTTTLCLVMGMVMPVMSIS